VTPGEVPIGLLDPLVELGAGGLEPIELVAQPFTATAVATSNWITRSGHSLR